MIHPPKQLSLSVALQDEATFANFFAPADSPLVQVVAALQEQLIPGQEPFLFVWGATGSGVSHLLQATCHSALDSGLTVQYLPLAELIDYPPEALFDGLEHTDLICLDQLQSIAGNATWEQALFHLFNRLRDSGCRLLVGANASARELGVELPDLQSRLSWGATFHLPLLSDDHKVSLLILRAAERGMEVGDNVARYILNHGARDLSALIAVLDQLDKASLQAQRKLTIPFIKEILNW